MMSIEICHTWHRWNNQKFSAQLNEPPRFAHRHSKILAHSGLSELEVGELAVNLAAAGHSVTVATTQWSRHWSHCVHFYGIPVVRFTRPIAGPWSSFRYARSLARYLVTSNHDGIIANGLTDEATAALKRLEVSVPIVMRLDESQVAGNSLNKKQLENIRSADAVVATSECVADTLGHAGVDHCTVIRPGFGESQRNHADPALIRKSLSKAHPILQMASDQPLVVSCTRMNRYNRLQDLVAAWPSVLKEFPLAKLWLVGQGEKTGALWQQILDLELAHSILLPGYFDQISDLFAAADLYVHAAGEEQNGDGLVRALVAGSAVVSSANRFTQQHVQHQKTGLLVAPTDTQALAAAMITCLKNPNWRLSLIHI